MIRPDVSEVFLQVVDEDGWHIVWTVVPMLNTVG